MEDIVSLQQEAAAAINALCDESRSLRREDPVNQPEQTKGEFCFSSTKGVLCTVPFFPEVLPGCHLSNKDVRETLARALDQESFAKLPLLWFI